jgi:hypothetical protein
LNDKFALEMNTSTVNLDFCEISVAEPGIILILFKKDTDLDESAAVQLLSALVPLTQGEPHALVYDMNKKDIIIREITRKISGVRDARTSNLICRAIVAGTLQNRLEAKHYIQSGKPSAETKYFNYPEDALKWAREQLKQFKLNIKA